MTADAGFLRFGASGNSRGENMHGTIAAAVEDLGIREGWEAGLIFKVNLILDELATNIVSYGGTAGRRGPEIEIDILCREEEVVIEIRDDGRPFNPLNDAPPAPRIGGDTAAAPVGGLGLQLVKSMVDSLSYRHEDGLNQVTMIARRD